MVLDGALPKNFVLRTDYSKKITAKDPDLSKSESHIASHNDKSFVYFKVISKVEWINKKNQLTLDFIGFSNITQSNWFNCYFTHALRQKNEQLW